MFLVQPVKDLLGLDQSVRVVLFPCRMSPPQYIPNHEIGETTHPATTAARREAERGGAQAEGAQTARFAQGESAVRQAAARPRHLASGRARLEPAKRAQLSPAEGMSCSGCRKIRAANDRLQHPRQPPASH